MALAEVVEAVMGLSSGGEGWLDCGRRVLEEWVVFLEIPNRMELVHVWKEASRAWYEALVCGWMACQLTLKPLLILMGWLVQRITVWLGQHTIQKTSRVVLFIYEFQSNLSFFGWCMEGAFLLTGISIYMLRQFIRRKRYIPRIIAKYNSTKRHISNTFLHYQTKVSQTSLLLARLLPHVLYSLIIILLCVVKIHTNNNPKRSLLYYLSHPNGYLFDILSLYHPLWQTIQLLHYAPPSSSSSSSSSSKQQKSLLAKKSDDDYLVRHKEKQLYKDKQQRVMKYWVVYALLHALYEIWNHLPFIERIILRHIKSTTITYQVQLIFIIWLRYLPTPNTTTTTSIATNKKYTYKKKQQSSSIVLFANHQPLDILYNAISPTAISWIQHTTQTYQHATTNTNNQWTTVIWNKCQTILDMAVWVKLINKETKDTLLYVLGELAAILPAAMTLFMPGYFTKFGIIYVSYIVPAAYSAMAIHSHQISAFHKRYYPYWILHTMLSYLLHTSIIQSTLSWIFLSNHLIFLTWSYLLLESTTQHYYNTLQYELIAFGLLPPNTYTNKTNNNNNNNKNNVTFDLDQTITVRFIQGIIRRLPSGVTTKDSTKDDTKRKDTINTTNTKNDSGNGEDRIKSKQPSLKTTTTTTSTTTTTTSHNNMGSDRKNDELSSSQLHSNNNKKDNLYQNELKDIRRSLRSSSSTSNHEIKKTNDKKKEQESVPITNVSTTDNSVDNE